MIRRFIVCAIAAILALTWGPAAFAQTQGTNSSSTATASSGDAEASNDANANAGPSSNGGTSQQNGNNNVTIRQHSETHTGDAVAGSQVFGHVGGGALIQGTNNSTGATATSGASAAHNSATVNAGPSSTSTGGTSTAQQTGHNDVVVDQSSHSTTGDAVAGSQIVGTVSDWGSTIQLTNNSTDPLATSGVSLASNTALINAGPSASTGTTGTATANQIGDNGVALSQDSEATSGDAVAGSQVVGSVGGDASIQTTNNSDGAIAISGAAVATNTALINAGPAASAGGTGTASASQTGDNLVAHVQEAEATSGDAVAGSTVIGAVGSGGTIQSTNNSDDALSASGAAIATNFLDTDAGPFATTTTSTASASQIGDNWTGGSQTADASTGDAVAGSGVFGAVGGDYTIQATNNSDNAIANNAQAVAFAANTAELDAGPFANAGAGIATAAQTGDNGIALDQSAEATTGDAVAGSIVAGSIGGPTNQLTNNSTDAFAASGAATATNTALLDAGPVAASTTANAATANQVGDNDIDASQAAIATTGDGVAGSIVVGSVGPDGLHQVTNNAANSNAFSAFASASNAAGGGIGPATNNGTAQQTGDNGLGIDQSLSSSSGDGVSGSQVVGSA